MTDHIAAAVAPLKADAINSADARARRYIETMRAKLIEAGNDINVATPRPISGRVNHVQYLAMMRAHNSMVALCKPRACTRSMRDPFLADIDAEYVERFVKESRMMAAAQYDLFVMKLTRKIGPVTSATLAGNHVWSSSVLTVTLASTGAIEHWKTQQIWNVSKLGLHFPQWPSRRMK